MSVFIYNSPKRKDSRYLVQCSNNYYILRLLFRYTAPKRKDSRYLALL